MLIPSRTNYPWKMKTKILLLASALCLALGLQAQAPQKFNYQGIARSSAGAPLANQPLGLKISILDGNTVQYVEKHTVMTNSVGLYTLQIGGGTVVNGNMAAVTWSTGNKKIKVLIDPNGGTNYTNMGTTELLSVPYALYAGGGTQGPQGVPGAPGATGPQGPQGPPGTSGGYTAGAGVNISGGSVISSTLGTSIETAELANDAVTSAKISDGAVATADLANNAVTAVKIAPMGATNGQVLQYNGNAWAPATTTSGSVGWALNGNTATVNDFIGTTNDQDIRFKRNGVKAGLLSSTTVGNTAFGTGSLGALTTGTNNTAVGTGVLAANTTGTKNTVVGDGGLQGSSTGSSNTAIGWSTMYYNSSGYNNVAVGEKALNANVTGSGNVGIGYLANVTSGALTNATAIGNRAYVGQSNSLVLGSINGVNGATASTKVGIGTTTPNYPLTIKTNGIGFTQTSADGLTQIGTYVGGTGAFLQTNTDHPLRFATNNGSVQMSLYTNGSLGVGTSETPTARLEVKSFGYPTEPQLRVRETSEEYSRINFQNTNTGAWVLAAKKATTAANSLFNVFYTPSADGGLSGGYDILSISGQGKVGINTSSTGSGLSDAALNIRQKLGGSNALTVMNTDGTTKWGLYVAAPVDPDLVLTKGEAFLGAFDHVDGHYYTTSDRRLKENIAPATNILDRIKGVEVMHYTFKSDVSHQPKLGYIAQNLDEHFPEFVSKPDTVDGIRNFYTVDYAGMSAVAIKAIQEQQEMIERQQATINAQQATIESVQQALVKLQTRLDQLWK